MTDLGKNSQDPESEKFKMEVLEDEVDENQSSCCAVDNDFTTEIFKIEIGNLPKCYSVCVSIM